MSIPWYYNSPIVRWVYEANTFGSTITNFYSVFVKITYTFCVALGNAILSTLEILYQY